MLTLPSVLERTRLQHGQRVAIRDQEGDLTWAEYLGRVARAAGMLRGLEIAPGGRFGVLSRNSVRQAELIYAGYWGGFVPVPVNYRLAPGEIELLLEDAGCQALFVDPFFLDLLEHGPLSGWRDRVVALPVGTEHSPLPQYDALRDQARPVDPHDPAEDDDAILLYTGGTTGQGKGVRLSHRNVVGNALQLARAMSARQDDVYLHSSPMFHATDLKATVLTLMGASHAYLPEFSPGGVLAAIERHGITIASLVPTMIIRLLQSPEFGKYDVSTLRMISYGTSSMAAEWIRRTMHAFPGVDLQQVYGLTETSPVLALLDEHDHRLAMAGRDELLRAVGRVLPGVDLRIMDEDGCALPCGHAGEIWARGPQVARAYLNRPEENASTFRDGWLRTGDLGRLDEQGYLYVLDRKKDLIVTGGENVYAADVEAVIHQHPGVHEVAVIGVPDEQYGEALFAVIVPAPDRTLSAQEIIEHCRGRMGGYKIPRRMDFVDSLPKSTMGKVLKNALRKQYSGRPQTGG